MLMGWMAFDSLKKGFRPAKYYLHAWLIFQFFMLIGLAHLIGLLPAGILTYALPIGAVLKLLVMSFALAQMVAILEQEKNSALLQVKESEDTKYLLRVLYHDLSNPLHIIRSLLFLKRKKGRIDSFTEDFERASDMMHSILKHVRKTQSIKDGKIKLDLSPIQLKNVFNEARFVFKEKLENKKISLEIDPKSENIYILSDFNSVCHDVVNNIISNAIKFSYPDSKIYISAKKKDNFIHLEIRDEGVGMDQEMVDMLFKAESNCSRKGTNGEEGSGYGLTLVEKYMELYGGRIEVESEKEATKKGTLVRLIFLEA